MKLISLFPWETSVKKNSGAQAWICAAQTLYFSAHIEKIRGNIVLDTHTVGLVHAGPLLAFIVSREFDDANVFVGSNIVNGRLYIKCSVYAMMCNDMEVNWC